ncbi:hypothetical protein AKJ16_DCAP08669 [Drosera capensis]
METVLKKNVLENKTLESSSTAPSTTMGSRSRYDESVSLTDGLCRAPNSEGVSDLVFLLVFEGSYGDVHGLKRERGDCPGTGDCPSQGAYPGEEMKALDMKSAMSF